MLIEKYSVRINIVRQQNVCVYGFLFFFFFLNVSNKKKKIREERDLTIIVLALPELTSLIILISIQLLVDVVISLKNTGARGR